MNIIQRSISEKIFFVILSSDLLIKLKVISLAISKFKSFYFSVEIKFRYCFTELLFQTQQMERCELYEVNF